MRRLAAVLLVAALGIGGARAGTLNVSPVKVNLPPNGRPQVIRLENPSGQTTLVQVEAVAWAEPAAIDAAPRIENVLAVPPVFELAPEGSQVIRLALRQPVTAPVEQAYRLLITEVPKDVKIEGGGLAFAVRLNLPVFVTPAGAQPLPVWTIERAADGGSELVLANRGQAHLLIKRLAVRRPGDQAPLLASDEPRYALAGEAKRWPIDARFDQLPGELEIDLETGQGGVAAKASKRAG